MSDLYNLTYGVLEAGETGVVEGQALRWDATPELVTAIANDEYRFAGFAKITTDGEGTSPIGLASRGEVTPAIGDGTTLAAGDLLQLDAAGVLTDYVPITSYTHEVQAAEETAHAITLRGDVGAVLAVSNGGEGAGVAGDYTIVGTSGSTALGSIAKIVGDGTLDFKANDILDNAGTGDVLTITYVKLTGPVAVVVEGCTTPATAITVRQL